MFRLKTVVIFGVLASLMSQCKKGSGSHNDDDGDSGPGAGTVQIAVSDEDGAFSGAFTAGSDLTQVMAVPDDVPDLGGSFISVGPGALAIDTSLQVRKEADIGANIVSSAVEGNAVEGAGPAVSVKPTVAQNAVGTVAIGIPLPAGVTELSPTIAVAYATTDASTGVTQNGLMASGSLKISTAAGSSLQLLEGRTIVHFDTKYFGTFQAIKLKEPLATDTALPTVAKAYCAGREKETDFSAQVKPENDVYTICTKAQLKLVATRPMDGKYKLGANIDLTSDAFQPIGSDDAPFNGMFDGANFTIKGLKYEETDEVKKYVGLFRVIGEAASVSNLVLESFQLSNSGGGLNFSAGALAGLNYGVVTRLTVKGGQIVGDGEVGGLIGTNKGTVRRSSSSAKIMTAISGSNMGGLVGANGAFQMLPLTSENAPEAIIEDCFATGEMAGGGYVGGLVGYNYGSINRSYSAAPSIAGYYVGGLVGNFDGQVSTISNSFGAPAALTGQSYSTTLVGSDSPDGITNSYGSSDVSCPQDPPCDSPPATATRSELQNPSHTVYTGWNFTEIWNKPAVGKFPSLR